MNFIDDKLNYPSDEWVQLVFGEGDKYNNHCNKQARKAQILFICDPNVDENVSYTFRKTEAIIFSLALLFAYSRPPILISLV